jgi:hypothetical protein
MTLKFSEVIISSAVFGIRVFSMVQSRVSNFASIMTHSCVYDVGNGGIGANAGTVVGVVDVDAGTVVGNAVSAAFGITHANTLHSHI